MRAASNVQVRKEDAGRQQVNLGFDLRDINAQLEVLRGRVQILEKVYPPDVLRQGLLEHGQHDGDNLLDNADALRNLLDSYLREV